MASMTSLMQRVSAGACTTRKPRLPLPSLRAKASRAQNSTTRASSMATQPPTKISHMLETCIYCKDLPRSIDFYTNTLGLTPLFTNARMACYPIGHTTLLLFALGGTYHDVTPDASRPQNVVPRHGPSCEIVDSLIKDREQLRQHFCLAVEGRQDAERWEEYLREKKVKITGRNEWERGGYSVYFDDPDGNVGEIASRGIWPHY